MLEGFSATRHPVTNYEEAFTRVEAFRARDTMEIVPPASCTQLMTYGGQTERSVVLMHGESSSPPQFIKLGQSFYNRGYNVLIPRMPHHGLPDRMTTQQSQLTTSDLLIFANDAVDVAHGLGNRVTVIGFSLSGVLAGWCAQFRADIKLVMMINPLFGLSWMPARLGFFYSKMTLRRADRYIWIDPSSKEKFEPSYMYPRYSAHAVIGHGLQIASSIYRTARIMRPLARNMIAVTSGNDPWANHGVTRDIIRAWQQHGGNKTPEIRLHQLNHMPRQHDIIDPVLMGDKVNQVYSTLIDMAIEAGG
jgi:carboxylesterase